VTSNVSVANDTGVDIGASVVASRTSFVQSERRRVVRVSADGVRALRGLIATWIARAARVEAAEAGGRRSTEGLP